MTKLLRPLLYVFVVTTILFGISEVFYNLDADYFQEHKEELTTTETIEHADGSTINYFYAGTPYRAASNILGLIYIFFPAIVVVATSIKYLSKEKKSPYLKSLVIPLFFTALTFLLQLKRIIDAIGWEKDFGIALIGTYCLAIFLITAIINAIILRYNRRKSA